MHLPKLRFDLRAPHASEAGSNDAQIIAELSSVDRMPKRSSGESAKLLSAPESFRCRRKANFSPSFSIAMPTQRWSGV